MTETIHQNSEAAATARKNGSADVRDGHSMPPDTRFEQNRGLIYATLRKYWPALLLDEDAQQVAAIGLWKACRGYRAEIGRFSTYAVKCIYAELWKAWHRENAKKRKTSNCLSLDADILSDDGDTFGQIIPDEESEQGFAEIEDSDELTKLLLPFNERQQHVAYLRAAGYTQDEVARCLGISRSTVMYDSRVLRKGLLVAK